MNIHKGARLTVHSRALAVRRVLHEGYTARAAALAAGVSARTVYKWLQRFRDEGASGLVDRSSAPRRRPRALLASYLELIEQLRRSGQTARVIGLQLRLARSTVAAVLKRLGLNRLALLKPAEPVRRYERAAPGELVHLDTKKLGRFNRAGHRVTGDMSQKSRGVGWEFAHIAIDDYTRLAYVELLPNERGLTAAAFTRRALDWFLGQGIVTERIMTDNGVSYVNFAFRDLLKSLGIRHIRTRPYTPKTNGKAERFVQTLLREWAYVRPYLDSCERAAQLQPWLSHYNLHRPHASLAYHPPASRLTVLGP